MFVCLLITLDLVIIAWNVLLFSVHFSMFITTERSYHVGLLCVIDRISPIFPYLAMFLPQRELLAEVLLQLIVCVLPFILHTQKSALICFIVFLSQKTSPMGLICHFTLTQKEFLYQWFCVFVKYSCLCLHKLLGGHGRWLFTQSLVLMEVSSCLREAFASTVDKCMLMRNCCKSEQQNLTARACPLLLFFLSRRRQFCKF